MSVNFIITYHDAWDQVLHYILNSNQRGINLGAGGGNIQLTLGLIRFRGGICNLIKY